MAILGLPFRTLMTRAARRYHNSGLWLPGTKGKPAAAAEASSSNGEPNRPDDVVQTAPLMISEEAAPEGETRFEDDGSFDLSGLASLSSIESPGEPGGESGDEPMVDDPEPKEEDAGASLAEILANPLPPALNVDNLISESLGNIFQKKGTKDPVMRSLLDLHGNVDMQELAVELKRFAIEIGASKETE